MLKLALARINYSQFYGVFDKGKTYEKRDILIPYHLLVLAEYVRKRGVEVKIFDGEVNLLSEEDLAKEIVDWKPDFLGLTATTPDIDLTLKVAKYVKKANKDIRIILGGTHVSALPEFTKAKNIDFIIKGRGEEGLFNVLSGKIDIGGCTESCNNIEGNPAYDLLDYENYMFTDPVHGRVRAASVMSSFGCPYGCLFCFHSRNMQYKDVDVFIREIDFLYNEKDVRYFYIFDDTFLANKERALKIIDKLKYYKKAYFQCLARANSLDRDVVSKMKESNFIRVSMGLETGSEKLLKIISKGVKKEFAYTACNLLSEYEIESRGSFILGLPYESHLTIHETINFAKRLKLYFANFNILTPYPGTEIYNMALRGEGIHFDKEEYKTKWSEYRRWGKAIIRTDNLSFSDLENYQVITQTEFYARNKILDHYYKLYKQGNNSKYFYRPLNFAWRNKFGNDIPFWHSLESSEVVNTK